MAGLVLQGGNRIELWTATNNTTTATVGSSPTLTLTEQVSTQVEYDDTGVPTITVTHTDDSGTVNDWLNTYIDLSSTETEEIKYEDGTKLVGSSTAQVFLCAIRGALNSTTGARKSWLGLVTISPSSGSWTQEADTYNKPSFILNGIAAKGTVPVAATYLTSYMVTNAAQTFTSSARKYGKSVFG